MVSPLEGSSRTGASKEAGVLEIGVAETRALTERGQNGNVLYPGWDIG